MQQMNPLTHKCTRCGLCCLAGTCSEGTEGDDGVCTHLSFSKAGVASCALVVNKAYKEITVGRGCALKQTPNVYSMYMRAYADRKRYVRRTS